MRKKRRRAVILLVVAALIITVVYFQLNVTNVLLSMSEATIRSKAAVAVNNAVFSVMGSGVSYTDLVTIEYASDGTVSLISANSFKVNSIARSSAYMSQENLTMLLRDGVYVPMGAFTGMEILAGFGRDVNLKINPVVTVETKFVSKFITAGINQTMHSLYLNVAADITVVFPYESRKVSSESEVLVCESIIVGKIPDTFLSGSLFSS